jgi:hypothetical protein
MFSGSGILVRRWIPAVVLIAVGFGLVGSRPIVAQAPDNTIRDATLQLWPEYDDPGLLVLFSGDFTDTANFPQEVSFPLPAGARGIQATEKQADGRLINQTWQIANGKLVYSLPGPGFHIEYYLDRPPAGDQREISYSLELPYAIDTLNVRVQQPARSSGFSLIPPPDRSSVEADGLTYSVLKKTDLKPGDKLGLTLRYTKTDQGVSRPPSSAIPTASVAPVLSREAPAQDAFSWLPWLLIGIGLAALAAAVWYWFSRSRVSPNVPPAAKRARAAGTSDPGQTAPFPDGDAAFCTQCGQRFRPGDRFCANCGALR